MQRAGQSIRADALNYSFVGQRNVTNPSLGVIDAHTDETVISDDICCLVATAKANGGNELVLATHRLIREPSGVNREHGMELDFQ